MRSVGLSARSPLGGDGAPTAEDPAPGIVRLRRLHRGVKASIAVGIVAAVVLAGILVGEYASGNRSGTNSSSSLDQRQLAPKLVRGRTLVAQGKDAEAFKLFTGVLKVDPSQPEALAYEGWLLRLTGVARHNRGLDDQGLALVRRSIALDPTYPDAHLFLGIMLDEDAHDPKDAVAQLQLFLSDKPTSALVRRVAPVIDKVFADAHQPAPSLP